MKALCLLGLYRKKHLIFQYRIPLKCLPPCRSSSHFRPGAGQWYWHLDNRLLFSGVSLGKSVFLLQRLHLLALRPSGVLWVPVEVKTGEGLIETKEIMDIKANHSNGPVTLCPDLSLSLDIFNHIRDTLGCGGPRWGVSSQGLTCRDMPIRCPCFPWSLPVSLKFVQTDDEACLAPRAQCYYILNTDNETSLLPVCRDDWQHVEWNKLDCVQ